MKNKGIYIFALYNIIAWVSVASGQEFLAGTLDVSEIEDDSLSGKGPESDVFDDEYSSSPSMYTTNYIPEKSEMTYVQPITSKDTVRPSYDVSYTLPVASQIAHDKYTPSRTSYTKGTPIAHDKYTPTTTRTSYTKGTRVAHDKYTPTTTRTSYTKGTPIAHDKYTPTTTRTSYTKGTPIAHDKYTPTTTRTSYTKGTPIAHDKYTPTTTSYTKGTYAPRTYTTKGTVTHYPQSTSKMHTYTPSYITRQGHSHRLFNHGHRWSHRRLQQESDEEEVVGQKRMLGKRRRRVPVLYPSGPKTQSKSNLVHYVPVMSYTTYEPIHHKHTTVSSPHVHHSIPKVPHTHHSDHMHVSKPIYEPVTTSSTYTYNTKHYTPVATMPSYHSHSHSHAYTHNHPHGHYVCKTQKCRRLQEIALEEGNESIVDDEVDEEDVDEEEVDDDEVDEDEVDEEDVDEEEVNDDEVDEEEGDQVDDKDEAGDDEQVDKDEKATTEDTTEATEDTTEATDTTSRRLEETDDTKKTNENEIENTVSDESAPARLLKGTNHVYTSPPCSGKYGSVSCGHTVSHTHYHPQPHHHTVYQQVQMPPTKLPTTYDVVYMTKKNARKYRKYLMKSNPSCPGKHCSY